MTRAHLRAGKAAADSISVQMLTGALTWQDGRGLGGLWSWCELGKSLQLVGLTSLRLQGEAEPSIWQIKSFPLIKKPWGYSTDLSVAHKTKNWGCSFWSALPDYVVQASAPLDLSLHIHKMGPERGPTYRGKGLRGD